jgi:hypothetical protein
VLACLEQEYDALDAAVALFQRDFTLQRLEILEPHFGFHADRGRPVESTVPRAPISRRPNWRLVDAPVPRSDVPAKLLKKLESSAARSLAGR